MPTEPKIPKAPVLAPIGWGWSLMADNAERMGWDDYAVTCRDMATKSVAAGRDLMAGETVTKVENRGQLTLW